MEKKICLTDFKVEIGLPSVPNYLILRGATESGKLHISDLSEKDLRLIGTEWTEELVRKSKSKEKFCGNPGCGNAGNHTH